MIQRIYDPNEEVQLAAVRQNAFAIQFIRNSSEAVQLAAIKSNKKYIVHIEEIYESALAEYLL